MDTNDNDFDGQTEPGSSVFGDDATYGSSASVFGDDAVEPLGGAAPSSSVFGDNEGATESIVSSSVFGDEPVGAADLEDDPWADHPEPLTLDAWDTPEAVEPAPLPTAVQETIVLDEPSADDDLTAWSGLAPAESAPVVSTEQSWDPGPAPDEEPQLVALGDGGDFFSPEFGGNDDHFVEPASSGRDMQAAILTGVGLLALAVLAVYLGPIVALVLITAVVLVSVGEFFGALRVAGYQPATLLGIVGAVAMPVAVYFRGPQAVMLVVALSIVFGLLWFLAGISTDTPVMNLGVTLLGIVYVGVLGSFGAAMLQLADSAGNPSAGTGMLLAAIVVTVAYDVGGFFAGRSFGRTPLTSISPNKTMEGLVGGGIACIVAAVVVFSVVGGIDPWDVQSGQLRNALLLGVVGAIMAPLGDLGESLMKRDLGIKDMGSVLPGHGGFLDRFDALLFVLPAVYYLSLGLFY